ncbi:MAG: hypothetical protein IJA97_03065 [Clostridia bacterium]|nr:hypothetical protein [Clostridia bacterium]
MLNLLTMSPVSISILTGIGTSLFASIFYSLLIFISQPRVKISKDVCTTERKGKLYVSVKVINISKFLITNVNVQMFIKTKKGTVIFNRLDKSQDIPNIIKAKNKKDEEKSFSVIYKFSIKLEEKDVLFSNNSQLLFIFEGESTIYKSKISRYSEYTQDFIHKDCKFKNGLSLEVCA